MSDSRNKEIAAFFIYFLVQYSWVLCGPGGLDFWCAVKVLVNVCLTGV